jgi:hypothetical protein
MIADDAAPPLLWLETADQEIPSQSGADFKKAESVAETSHQTRHCRV